jgi:pyruvate/2-oxoglutarate dehydrogenase complex dihydrolipoamide acyltransferase (E2) component
MAIAIRRLDGRFRGHTIMERDDLAQNLVDVGSAEYVKDFPGHETAAAPPVETAEHKPISARMTRSQLQDMAEERGVKVSGTGRGGAVTKADLIAALS